MPVATLTSKGQITIPKSVRDALHLSSGDKIEIVIDDSNEAILKPVTKKVDDVFGCLNAYKKHNPVSIEAMDRAIAEKVKEKFSCGHP